MSSLVFVLEKHRALEEEYSMLFLCPIIELITKSFVFLQQIYG